MNKILKLVFTTFLCLSLVKPIKILNDSSYKCCVSIKNKSNQDIKKTIKPHSSRKIYFPETKIQEMTIKCRNLHFTKNKVIIFAHIVEGRSGVLYFREIY